MDEGLAAIAASRGGPFRVREALAAGYGRHAVRRMIAGGAWVRLRPGVLATADDLNDPDPARRHAVRAAAAILALGADAVCSHESAALMHGIALPAEPASVSLTRAPGRVHRDRIRGGRVHRAELPAAHVGRLFGVPVTSPARTVADLARRLPYRDAVVAADSAMFRRLAHREEIEDALAACAGWPGSGAAARVLATADPAARGPLATLARLMCAAAGLPKPRAGARVGGEPGPHAVADLYWRDHRVIVLLDDPPDDGSHDDGPHDDGPHDDGPHDDGPHDDGPLNDGPLNDGPLNDGGRDAARTERSPQARLERDGFIVVRLTWADVTGHPARSVDRIRAALALRGRT